MMAALLSSRFISIVLAFASIFACSAEKCVGPTQCRRAETAAFDGGEEVGLLQKHLDVRNRGKDSKGVLLQSAASDDVPVDRAAAQSHSAELNTGEEVPSAAMPQEGEEVALQQIQEVALAAQRQAQAVVGSTAEEISVAASQEEGEEASLLQQQDVSSQGDEQASKDKTGEVTPPQQEREIALSDQGQEQASEDIVPATAGSDGFDPAESLSVGANDADYGNDDCRCIGLDGVQGNMTLTIADQAVQYPSNFGTRCAAWHMGRHPECLKTPSPDWCEQPFCYVDACKCKDQGVPVLDPYLKDGRWQNLQIYYSYTTCGADDIFTKEHNPTACVNQKTQNTCDTLDHKCSWTLNDGCVGKAISGPKCTLLRQNDVNEFGSWDCPCIGMAGKKGNYSSPALGVDYDISAGSTCKSWHDDTHPKCKGSNKPEWCSQSWCFVDPCNCHGVVPKIDNVFTGGHFDANSVFYSFTTCGVKEDKYTPEENPDACSQQMSEAECTGVRCMWSFMGNDQGYKCRGIEFATNCRQTAFNQTVVVQKDAAAATGIARLVFLASALLLFTK